VEDWLAYKTIGIFNCSRKHIQFIVWCGFCKTHFRCLFLSI